MNAVTPFVVVFRRECYRMTSRRIYLASTVILPLFLLFFMCTIFGDGQMRHLPIGIVDADNTATSREIIRNIVLCSVKIYTDTFLFPRILNLALCVARVLYSTIIIIMPYWQ